MFTAPVVMTVLAALAPASIQLERGTDGEYLVRVAGGSSGTVKVFVAGQSDPNLPPLLGTTDKHGADLIFTPRFPLQEGREYRIEFSDGASTSNVVKVPSKIGSVKSAVRHVYPSTMTLPANQLKLYVEFSAPMSRGEAYRHVHLLDENGSSIDHAFLELGEELWDSSQTRFTLLFDPGRIKRDLVPNKDDGAPLKPGKHYTFVVDETWPDSRGERLLNKSSKQFVVAEADRLSPEPKSWLLGAPRASTRDLMTVTFPEPMDYGLLLHTIKVTDASGKSVAGSVSIGNDEKLWSFTPANPWSAGDYRLIVDGTLEDLAGNRIGRLFEVDTRTSNEMANRPSGTMVTLSFPVRTRSAE